MNKTLKKVLALAMCLAMLGSFAVTSFAAHDMTPANGAESSEVGRTVEEGALSSSAADYRANTRLVKVDDETDDLNNTANAIVWYDTNTETHDQDDPIPEMDSIYDQYKVTIPMRILATKLGTAEASLNKYEVKADDVLLNPGNELNIAANYSGSVANQKDTTKTVTYKMQKTPVTVTMGTKNTTDPYATEIASEADGTLADFATGAEILTVAAGTPFDVFKVKVNAALTADVLFAGVYEDTNVTFVCSVDAA